MLFQSCSFSLSSSQPESIYIFFTVAFAIVLSALSFFSFDQKLLLRVYFWQNEHEHGGNVRAFSRNQEWSSRAIDVLQARLDQWFQCRHQVLIVASEIYLNYYHCGWICTRSMLQYWCFRILAPTTYIFFASAIPVISFGEQLERNTSEWNQNFKSSRCIENWSIYQINFPIWFWQMGY